MKKPIKYTQDEIETEAIRLELRGQEILRELSAELEVLRKHNATANQLRVQQKLTEAVNLFSKKSTIGICPGCGGRTMAIDHDFCGERGCNNE